MGAGPAGSATALFLLKRRPDLEGRVLLLEKKRFPRDKVCAGAIGARADRLLHAIGVEVSVPSVAVGGFSVRTRHGDVVWSRGSIGRVVRRDAFDAALASAARARGAILEEGSPVERVSIEEGCVRVDTRAGSHTARVVAGADGVGSRVRRELGLPFGRFKAAAIEADTGVLRGDPPGDLLHFDFSDRSISGYAWDFPTPLEGGVKMSRGLYVLAPEVDIGQHFTSRLQQRGVDAQHVEKKRLVERGFEFHRPTARPRVLLVGEAAGIDPFNGEGIAPAILYGALAARYLAESLATGDLRFRDWPRRVRMSSLGLELMLSRLLVPLFYGALRGPLEHAFRRLPRVLWLITGMFAGRIWSHRDLLD